MPDPLRPAASALRATDPANGPAPDVAASRPRIEDPLEELARILGEGGAYPVRPEAVVEVGRRATPTTARAMPQQLSALEAELFDELRSSVAPEARVIRGETAREMPPVIPQRPVDDRDIASLRIDPYHQGEEQAPAPSVSAPPNETPYSDYYAYDEGVSAGSYDPALATRSGDFDAAFAREVERDRGAGLYPRPTFDEFGREEIATAARETSPFVAAEPGISPHSRREERAADRLMREPRRSPVLRLVSVVVGLAVLGGGAWAGWKTWSGGSLTGEPVLIRADGKPMKQAPTAADQAAAAAGDSTKPVLAPDNPAGASKIVSLQEDPVDQVNGRTPEGREVRVINPGAPRTGVDQPRTVKTVVVRPDGSIVTDTGAPVVNQPVIAAPAPPAQSAQPLVSAQPPVSAPPEVAPTKPASNLDADAKGSTAVKITTVKPVTVTASPQAPQPMARPTAPVTAKPAPIKTVTATPVPVPTTAKPAGSAPLSLGPVAPKLAAATPATQPAAPAPAAPVAITPPASSGGAGEYLVQISASKSDADARSSFAAAQRKYGVLAGKSVDVQQANLGDKGVFYRARVSAGSREQATALCTQLQAQGGQCMVVRR